jgi:LysR family transcriptional regulator, low CO2-responsive transcriptional regulator
MFPAESLPAFLVFAQHLNFTRAAAELHISQPALHVKVRKLAEAMGKPLYRRVGRRLVLTVDGEALARFARDREEQLTRFLAGTTEPGPIVLAAGAGAYLYLLGDVIARNASRLRLMTASRTQALAAVRDGRAHIGVAVLDVLPGDLDTVLLATYPQMLVVHKDDPRAHATTLTLADLDGTALIVPPPTRPLRVHLERALNAAGVAWSVAVETEGWPLMLHFVRLGVGAAVVNGCVDVGPDLVGVPITDLPTVPYYAVHHPDTLRDPRADALLVQIRLGST